MSWARLDDAILDNPKILAAGPLGLLLHVAAITWCARNLTDGLIPKPKVRTLVAGLDGIGTALAAPPACGPEEDRFWPCDADEIAEELARIGLWHDRGFHWELHDYLTYNPSRAKVLSDREKARSKKALQRVSPDMSPRDSQGDTIGIPGHPVPVPGSRTQKKIKDLSLASLARPRATRALRATPWPDDFTLTPDRMGLGREVGVEMPWEWNKFKDHHQAKGSRFVNWDAAWRTWLRNSVEFQQRRRG